MYFRYGHGYWLSFEPPYRHHIIFLYYIIITSTISYFLVTESMHPDSFIDMLYKSLIYFLSYNLKMLPLSK